MRKPSVCSGVASGLLVAASAHAAVAPVIRAAPEPGRLNADVLPAPSLSAPRTDPRAWPASRTLKLPQFNADQLIAQDVRAHGVIGLAPRVAAVRTLDALVDPAASGTWSTLPTGAHAWRLRIEAPEALALRIHFSAFDIPTGATLRVTGSDDQSPAQTYTGRGPLNDSEFWSHTFEGSSAWLEYIAPPEITIAPIIEISQVLHTYRDPASDRATQGERAALALLPCEQDVNCHDVSDIIRDSVARITFISGQFAYLCSGGLIADRDASTQIPWFITAHHCISTEDEARSVEAFWFYQSFRCDGTVPRLTTVPRTLGASLIVTTDQTDFTLLRLTTPTTRGQTYAGWSTDPDASGDMIGVHHPGGSYKRVSFSHTADVPFPGVCISPSNFIYTRVNLGVTEAGSSGSPLFNTSGEIVGQLLGGCGDPDCNYNVNPDDIYGRFAASYLAAALDNYLNVEEGGDDDFEPNDFFIEPAAITPGDYDLQAFDDDFYTFQADEPGRLIVTASFNAAATDLDLELVNTAGDPVAASRTREASERITLAVNQGSHIIRVNLKAGGGPYHLRVAFEPGLESDLDASGAIDAGDVLRILQQWGTFCPDLTGQAPCADLNHDARVGQPDLEIVLRDFGLTRGDADARAWKRQIKSLYTTDIAPLIDTPRGTRARQKKLDLQRLLNAAP